MAERIEEPETTADATLDPPSPAAMALALGRTSRGRTARPLDRKAEAFLDEQTDLIRLQKEHLHEQRAVILARLRLGRWKDRVTLSLQALTGLVGLIVAAALAVMAWQAHEDHGVTIEAFSVPPDFAQRGLTGQVVAGQLLDRLADLQARTVTNRPASTYANDWGDDIKVEIPETGVSIGELNRYFRQWLGNETQITGAVVRTPSGIAITARAGAAPGRRFEGAEADIDKLIAQAAEAVYAQTQPYRYAVYLASQGKADQALADYRRLAEDDADDPKGRAWAYLGWATLLFGRNDPRGALAKVSEAIRLDPRIDSAYAIRENADAHLGQFEGLLADAHAEVLVLESGRAEGFSPQAARAKSAFVRDALMGQVSGDYAGVVAAIRRMPQSLNLEGGGSFSSRDFLAQSLIDLHDVYGALRQYPAGSPPSWETRFDAAEALDDWQTALGLIDQQPGSFRAEPRRQAQRAMLLARLDRIAEAQAAIASTPLDCTGCLLARAEIAAYAGDRRGADRWFSEAVRQAPLPVYYFPWGQSLLILGDPDAAIVELNQAHKLGPYYADPLEVWGEALMAKRDYLAAMPKFAEADKDAPRWGRNHLRWGEALMLSGRYAEARAQYLTANSLDLSKADRAALDVILARTATGPLHG